MAIPSLRTTAVDPTVTLSELFQDQYAAMVRAAFFLLRDPGQAEEVVQDAFVKLHRSLPRLRDPGAAVGYLRSTVINLARSRIRRLIVARRHPQPVPLPERGADEAAVISDEHRAVLSALDTLPRRQRECLVLRYYLSLTEAEIAAALSISAGSVKTHTSRGLATLSNRLEHLR